jgi:2-polyprenyl-3-methyl-5-hydroxy-6-metoxy-1,4-benzoquinol methylase
VPDENDLVARGYDSFCAVWAAAPRIWRIWRIWREHVTGPDYPEEFAHISFLPLAQLRALAEGLNLAAGQVLVDLACGAGDPGLWVAKQSGARLVGRDLSPVAAERATERAAAQGMEGRAEFGQGSLSGPGLLTSRPTRP